MDAGRELDALVAKKVLGWTDIYHAASSHWYGRPAHHTQKPRLGIPGFSTCWGAMREVVEAMRERGYYLSISVWPDHVHASFVRRPDGEAIDVSSYISARGASLPHAVCEAAIAAMKNVNNLNNSVRGLDSTERIGYTGS